MKTKLIYLLIFSFTTSVLADDDVIGGQLLAASEYPEVVQFKIKRSNSTVNCTGTFISSNTILTAAHCLTEVIECKPYQVLGKNISLVIDGVLKKSPVKSILTNSEFLDPPSKQDGKCVRRTNPRYDLGLIIFKNEIQKKSLKVSTQFAKAAHKNVSLKYRTIGFGNSIIPEIEIFSKKYFKDYDCIQENNRNKKQIGHIRLKVNNEMMPLQSVFTEYIYDSASMTNYKSSYAQLLPGDSGGPLINNKNEIVGINSQFHHKEITTEGKFGKVIGYKTRSYFTPTHRIENIKFLKLAKAYGSNFSLDP